MPTTKYSFSREKYHTMDSTLLIMKKVFSDYMLKLAKVNIKFNVYGYPFISVSDLTVSLLCYVNTDDNRLFE